MITPAQEYFRAIYHHHHRRRRRRRRRHRHDHTPRTVLGLVTCSINSLEVF